MIKKHGQKKKDLNSAIAGRYFEKMEYFMDCEFNLLVFGVGSKRKMINNFVNTIQMPKIVVNGYHVATTIRTVLNSVTRFQESCFNKANKRKFHNQSE